MLQNNPDFVGKVRHFLRKQRCDIPQGVLFFVVVYLIYIFISLRSLKNPGILPKTANFSTPLDLNFKYIDRASLEKDWDTGYSSILRNGTHYPNEEDSYVRIFSGFHFCRVLNNASFFTDVSMRLVSGNVKLKLTMKDLPLDSTPFEIEKLQQTRISEFINFIEEFAKNAENSLPNWVPRKVDVVDMDRDILIEGLCLSIAQGNRFHPFSDLRILRTLDPSNAFPFLNFGGNLDFKWKQEFIPKEKKYSLVYFVETHSGWESVNRTISSLNSQECFFYIHIDHQNWALHKRIRHEYLKWPNVFIASNFRTKPEHSSNLWSFIRALNDLDAMIEYDWIINISDGDYPLHTTSRFVEHLSSKPDFSWIKFDDSKSEIVIDAYAHVRLCSQEEYCPEIKTLADSIPDLHFGLDDIFRNYTSCSNSGFIFSSSFVKHFRRSPAAFLLLATFHMVASSDDFFWSAFAASASPLPLMEDDKRLNCINVESAQFRIWNETDTSVVSNHSSWAMFIRNLDVNNNSSFVDYLDNMRINSFSLTQFIRPNNTKSTTTCDQLGAPPMSPKRIAEQQERIKKNKGYFFPI